VSSSRSCRPGWSGRRCPGRRDCRRCRCPRRRARQGTGYAEGQLCLLEYARVRQGRPGGRSCVLAGGHGWVPATWVVQDCWGIERYPRLSPPLSVPVLDSRTRVLSLAPPATAAGVLSSAPMSPASTSPHAARALSRRQDQRTCPSVSVHLEVGYAGPGSGSPTCLRCCCTSTATCMG
jgi:hypothetical protein